MNEDHRDRLAPLFSWRAALTESGLPPTTRHVLLTLSLHMSERGENAFPSVDTLAHETGLSKRCVITQLQRGEDDGWIRKVVFGYTDQRWKRHKYIPMIPEAVKEVHRLKSKAGERVAPPLQNDAVNEVHHLHEIGGEPDSPPSEKAVNVVPEGGEPDDKKVVNDVHSNSSVNSPVNSSSLAAREPGQSVDTPDGVPRDSWAGFEQHRTRMGRPLNDIQRRTIWKTLLAIPENCREPALDSAVTRDLREPCYDARPIPTPGQDSRDHPRPKTAMQRAEEDYFREYGTTTSETATDDPPLPRPHAGALPRSSPGG